MPTMAPPPKGRTLKLVEDLILLGAAGLLAAWAFTDRPADWHPLLWLAAAVAAAILIRRLAGWIRTRREAPKEP